MKKKNKHIIKGVIAFIITCVMTVCMLPVLTDTAQAAITKTESNTRLGTGEITNPGTIREDHPEDAGKWCYVYYGHYFSRPLKFRVLDKDAAEFGGETMLLDCDQMMMVQRFDDDSNVWDGSEIKAYLNGGFLATTFTSTEQAAIAQSFKSQRIKSMDGIECMALYDFVPLTGEKIFLLDALEITNEYYGYLDTHIVDASKVKSTTTTSPAWWLRSSKRHDSTHAGVVEKQAGFMSYRECSELSFSVSPALNLSLSSILFSTKLSDNEFKLTIKDEAMSIAVSDLASNGNEITVPFTTGGGANRISVLITDKAYNEAGAETKYYRPLSIEEGSAGASGYGVFTLPDTYIPSSDKVYIIAENTNWNDKYTDFASEPLLITIPVQVNKTVTFESNGGSGSMEEQTVPRGVSVALNENTFTKEGFTFTEWNTAADGSGVSYADRGRIRISEPVILYAQWKANSFDTLQTLIDGTTDGGVLTLGGDYLAITGESGLRIPSGKAITLDLNGHTIDRGLKEKDAAGDGYVVNNEGSLILKDTAGGGRLTGGNAAGNGGGITNTGTLTLEGGTITENTASRGGGIVNNGTLILANGSTVNITENNCASGEAGNVFLPSGHIIYVEGIPSDIARIGISTEDAMSASDPVEFTDDYDSCDASCFTSDKEGLMTVKRAGEGAKLAVPLKVTFYSNDGTNASCEQEIPAGVKTALNGKTFSRENHIFKEWNTKADGGGSGFPDRERVVFTEDTTLYAQWAQSGSFAELQTLINNTEAGGTLKLENDYAALSDEGDRVWITINKSITLDLNGHTIDKAQRGGRVLSNSSDFTLTDTSEKKNGRITGGSVSGITNNGTFTMLGGCITGNSTPSYGGGVNNTKDATFIMKGGSITDNYAVYGGGGVGNGKGTDGSHRFIMTGGRISDNSAGYGGGIYEARFSIATGDSPIIIEGNTVSSRENNYYVNAYLPDYYITVDSTPASGSRIGVTIDEINKGRTFTHDYTGTDTSFFFSDDRTYMIMKDEDKSAWLASRSVITFDGNGGTGAMDKKTVIAGVSSPLPANAFSRAGFDFAGWNTKPDGSGTAYGAEAEVSLDKDTTLYAQWAEKAGDKTRTSEGKIGSGEVYVETFVDEDTPQSTITGLTAELCASILTNEEKTSVESGETLTVSLDMKNIDDTVSDDDKMKTEAKAKEAGGDGAKVGMYLDISLYKKIGSNTASLVHETNGHKVSVVLSVPEALRNTNRNITRTFFVIRLHGDLAEKLKESTDTEIPFESDCFSTYALAYSDKQNDSDSGNNSGSSSEGGNSSEGGGNGSGSSGSSSEGGNSSEGGGNGSGSSGSSGGGGGSSPSKPDNPTPGPTPDPTPDPESYTIPVTNETSVQVETEITDGNAVVSEITAKDIEKITEPKSGEEKPVDTLTIDLSGAKQEVNSVELSKTTVENIADAVSDDSNSVDTVTIQFSNAMVELDAKALESVSEQAKGEKVQLVVDENVGQDNLNAKQKKAISQYGSATVFEAYFESNGSRIHDFGGGKARISVRYSLLPGLLSRFLHMLYLNPNGTTEHFPTTYDGEWVSGELDHFSEYAIVYDDSYSEEDAPKDEDPDVAVEMHRLYNPNSGEHFFTGNVVEKDFLITLGWSYEGVAWYAPESSSVPVYRLYNPNAGDHHYTMNKGERDILI
ncbi:MAG: InlB B-repeat-containing protein, partial [Lachnospiraceae bacterium]|nr:InlB B-repeat-containing protein [Lachnospiraceae bacterium]